jgi:hypothetical protein
VLRACTPVENRKHHSLDGLRVISTRGISKRFQVEQAMISRVASLVLPALCATTLLSLISTPSFADERCAQLVALSKQYAGVRLTDEQKQIKVKLVAWYRQNCGGHRIRSVRHAVGDS